MIPFLNVAQYLVLVLWVGSLFGFGVLYAPVLLRNLTSREQAYTIVGETMARLDSMGLVAGGVLLIVTALQAIEAGWRAIDLGRLLLTAVMLGLVVLSSVTVRQGLTRARQEMGRPIDELSEEDPKRREFLKYQRIGYALLAVNTLFGALLLGLSALR